MIAYMLDTDICSYLMRGKSPALEQRLQSVSTGAVCMSAITLSELAFGVASSPRREQTQQAFDFLLQHVQVLDYPKAAAADYGDIRATLKAQGTLIGPNDLLIAAHARHLNLTLVSNNTREFARVPGLKVENWV
jgi:tRNA(fMet)-specific endonuclease VapC